MKTNSANLVALKKLMLKHHISARQVADLVMREHQTVRLWLCGGLKVPDSSLALLKLRLASQ